MSFPRAHPPREERRPCGTRSPAIDRRRERTPIRGQAIVVPAGSAVPAAYGCSQAGTSVPPRPHDASASAAARAPARRCVPARHARRGGAPWLPGHCDCGRCAAWRPRRRPARARAVLWRCGCPRRPAGTRRPPARSRRRCAGAPRGGSSSPARQGFRRWQGLSREPSILRCHSAPVAGRTTGLP